MTLANNSPSRSKKGKSELPAYYKTIIKKNQRDAQKYTL